MHATGAYTAFAVRAIGPMGFVMRICNLFVIGSRVAFIFLILFQDILLMLLCEMRYYKISL